MRVSQHRQAALPPRHHHNDQQQRDNDNSSASPFTSGRPCIASYGLSSSLVVALLWACLPVALDQRAGVHVQQRHADLHHPRLLVGMQHGRRGRGLVPALADETRGLQVHPWPSPAGAPPPRQQPLRRLPRCSPPRWPSARRTTGSTHRLAIIIWCISHSCRSRVCLLSLSLDSLDCSLPSNTLYIIVC